ncbi:MAG: ribulose-phosphate 3-epimerase [Clostridia bacterium]|nr:ribulose-phosphate 3-epimerase [Clostridia bacterium]
MRKYLSASLMCADLTDLKTAVAQLEQAGIDYLHLDIMDGSFVPNITLGFDLVNALKKITDLPLDVHMMVSEPGRFLDRMALSQRDILCVHYEADVHVQRTLTKIREKGCLAGLAINPSTPPEVYRWLADEIDMALVMTVSPGFAGQKLYAGAAKKTAAVRALLDECGKKNVPIEVDGNITPANGKLLSGCGAEIFVLGTSALFGKDRDLGEAASAFRQKL